LTVQVNVRVKIIDEKKQAITVMFDSDSGNLAGAKLLNIITKRVEELGLDKFPEEPKMMKKKVDSSSDSEETTKPSKDKSESSKVDLDSDSEENLQPKPVKKPKRPASIANSIKDIEFDDYSKVINENMETCGDG